MTGLSWIRPYLRPRVIVPVLILLLLVALPLKGQELESAATQASTSMKRIFKIGAEAIGLIGVVGGLIAAAYKFFNKHEDAGWALACAAGGGVIVTIALTLM